eukprot:13157-Prymnesium_polylepis.1
MADLCALTEGMENLAAAMVRKSELQQSARERTSHARNPDQELDLQGSGYKQCCSSGECHEKFEMLRGYVCSPQPQSQCARTLSLSRNDCSVHVSVGARRCNQHVTDM